MNEFLNPVLLAIYLTSSALSLVYAISSRVFMWGLERWM